MRMKQIIFTALLAFSSAISLRAHAEERPDWPADCKLVRMTQLPMTLKSGHVTIPASVNRKDGTLGIDTGGPLFQPHTGSRPPARERGTSRRFADRRSWVG
jgi:hypothetical protein